MNPRILTFAILTVVLAGCAGAYDERRSSNRLKGRMRFAIERDSPLYASAVEAADQWSKVTGRDITATDDGDIPIVIVDQMSSECADVPVDAPPGTFVGACSLGYDTLDRRIEVNRQTVPAHYLHTLLHEMGHHLRGGGGHLDDPNVVMSKYTNDVTTLTPADVAFICENFPCDAAAPVAA
jgi:hypothetical protein